jgi:hypothetical protein
MPPPASRDRLTSEAEAILESAQYNPAAPAVLTMPPTAAPGHQRALDLTAQDVLRAAPGEWLGSSLINAYARLLMVADADIYIVHTELAAMMTYRPRCHLCKCPDDPCVQCEADPAHATASPACECAAVSAEAVDATTLDNKLPANCDVTAYSVVVVPFSIYNRDWCTSSVLVSKNLYVRAHAQHSNEKVGMISGGRESRDGFLTRNIAAHYYISSRFTYEFCTCSENLYLHVLQL